MQLFTIGLYQLNADGTPPGRERPFVETYGQDDVSNGARVHRVLDPTATSRASNPSATATP
jgi:uncharacterized protein (DUF1800 family)